jgi:hypothetical protein
MHPAVDSRRFVKDVTRKAREQARLLGSPRVEAEHLLLALAAAPRWPAGALLADEGLDRCGVLEALDLEFERSLGAVGILLLGLELPAERLPFNGELRFGQSAKLAFRRALLERAQRRDPRFDSLMLLVGILRADEGVVARALAAAGADRAALLERAGAALAAAA